MILTRVASGLVVGLTVAAFGVHVVCAEPAAAHHDPPAQQAADEHAGQPEAADEHGDVNTNPLEFKKDLALWTAVVFLVLLTVLWKFAWGPIVEGLQRREQGIADQINQAERSNRRAEELLAQYEQKLADSKDEVRGVLDQARRDAEQLGREMLDTAKGEAQAEQQRALRQIDAATANALKELAELSADLAVELAGKIVRAELTPDAHAQLIQQAVANFAQSKPSVN